MDEQSTILIVDDTKTNLDILLEFLDDSYAVIPALSAKDALDTLDNFKVDLILSDIVMPSMDGFELYEKIKSSPKHRDIPIIFTTSKDDGTTIEKAYDIGGADYITKPFKSKEVKSRVRMQLKLKDTIKHLEYLSFHDDLTRVYNRRKFYELAKEKFECEKEKLYAVMIDIDSFKSINDTYGHPVGDKVIKNISEIIDSLKPDNSIFGRLGGEEFSLLLNEKNEARIIQIIETMRKQIEEKNIYTKKGDTISVTISIGISKYSDKFKSIDEFLEDADLALSDAKSEGRNKSTFRGIKSRDNKKANVLVVDDTVIMQDILADFLEQEGFNVVGFAENGQDAYEKYCELKPDVVTMDLDMPIMDGEQCSKKILEFDNNAKVLMVSAHGQSRLKQDAVAQGLSGYITKPFEKQVLINEMNLALQGVSV